MAMGRRTTERQQELFLSRDQLPRSAGHAFYDKLNRLLDEAGFDAFVEALCEPFYAKQGRPSIPPGVYFRMILLGYLEGIDSQRGIAWRCADSLSLRAFLGVPLGEESPDHSSLSYIRDRLPLAIHGRVFVWVLALIAKHKLLQGRTVGVDSTLLEADAAMKSIVRRDTGEDWKEYLLRLMKEEGRLAEDDEPPSDDELRRFDQSRKNKRVSNEEWTSPTDPDSRVARMKDGRTHLAYKAEHVVDLETDVIVAAEIYHADQSDAHTLEDSLVAAQTHQREAGHEEPIVDVVADKGYHANEQLAAVREHTRCRTYIPEPASPHRRVWTDKPAAQREAVYANRRRTRGARGRRLQRLRSEKCERTFAHVCGTGGARRTWLTGIEKVRKRYLLAAAAHNLSVLMRSLFRTGTPRGLRQFRTDLEALLASCFRIWTAVFAILRAFPRIFPLPSPPRPIPLAAA